MLRQQLASWLGHEQLTETQVLDDAITTGKHGYRISPEALQAARDIVEALLAPAPNDQIVLELVRCELRTKRAKSEAKSDAMLIQVYTEDLSEFPLDAVQKVLREWPRTNMWFPALAEIYPALTQAVAYRRAALEWIEQEMACVPDRSA